MSKIANWIFNKANIFFIAVGLLLIMIALTYFQLKYSTTPKNEIANITTIISAGLTMFGLYLTILQQRELKNEFDIITQTKNEIKKGEVEKRINKGDTIIDNIISNITNDTGTTIIPELNELKKIFMNCQNSTNINFNKEDCTKYLRTINSAVTFLTLNNKSSTNKFDKSEFIPELLEMRDTLTNLSLNCD